MGSLLKPAIYLTALSDPERYTLTPIDDSEFVWKSRGAPDWQPANYDKKFPGMVPLRTALAQSYNAAAARLGTELGIERVIENVRRLGVERPLRPFASTLLGAVELSPLEVAQMYQTIASGGFRSPLRAIREVTTQEGRPLTRYPLAVEQVFAPEPIYLLSAAMQEVVRAGTGQGLNKFLPPESLRREKPALRTSSATPGLRVSPATASPWCGSATTTTAPRGSRIGRCAADLGRHDGGARARALALAKPERIELVAIDPQTGLRGGVTCPGSSEVPFVQGSAPRDRAPCSGAMDAAVEAVGQTVERAKSWLDRPASLTVSVLFAA